MKTMSKMSKTGNYRYLQREDGTYRVTSDGHRASKICSFQALVLCAHTQRAQDGDTLRFTLRLSSGSVQTTLKDISERDLQKLQWETLPAAFRISPPLRTNSDFFLEYIQQMLAQIDAPVKYIPQQTGWNIANGKQYFLFGNELILPPELENCVTVPDNLPYTVFINKEISEKDVASWFTNVLTCVSTLSLPLCLATILGLLFSKLREHGHIPEGWLWVIGRSSAGKTSLVQNLCCLYNRNENLKACTIPASSTIAYASRKIQTLKDTVCIIDDKALTEGKSLSRKQTDLIDSLLRSSSNDVTRGSCVTGEMPASCYFVGTAETGFCAESVVNRGIALEIPSERIDFTNLNHHLSDTNHLLETFYAHFLHWMVEKPDLDLWLDKHIYDATHPADSHHLQSPRVASHIAFYKMAAELLLDYLAAINVLDTTAQEKWRNYITNQLQKIYERQLILLSRLRPRDGDTWLAKVLYDLICSGRLKIAESHRLSFPSGCDGFKYQKTPETTWICLRRDSLFQALEDTEIYLTLHELQKELAPRRILIRGSSGEATRNIAGERGIILNWTQLYSQIPKCVKT